MITFRNDHAVRFSLGRVGFHVQAGNLDDIAYLLGYLERINYQSMASLEVDFFANDIYLCFDTIANANLFLGLWKVAQASLPASQGSD